MVYTHVLMRGLSAVRSPLDVLHGLAPDEVQAAVDATRRLHGRALAPGSL